MIERKYLDCRNNDYRAENEHYAVCQRRAVPHIIVSKKQKYASVSWDHITLPSALDRALQDNAEEIANSIFAAYRRHSRRTSTFQGGALTGDIHRLDPQSAEALAGEIYDILAGHLATATQTG